jgi:hypothetical protein
MQRVYAYAFYRLSKALQPLAALTHETKYGERFLELATARNEIQALLDNPIIPVAVCRASAEQLKYHITAVVPEDIALAVDKNASDPSLTLTWMQAYNISEELKRFETVLGEELRLVDTYSVSRKGIYSTTELIERADGIFPEAIRLQLSSQTRKDIVQAGKCLAFETGTACAFHIFRAVETVIIQYYEHTVGTLPHTRLRNWGLYLQRMRKAKADEKILELLQHLKDEYRNPITHPDVDMTVEEALELLGLAVGVISKMTRALISTPPTASLPSGSPSPPLTP